MFTGLIEEVGEIENIKKGAKSLVLTVKCKDILDDVKVGDSIALNGVCLTVTSLTGHGYTADVMNETINRSMLKDLKVLDQVNLERAMAVNDRFGGHIVSGHIDGTGNISQIEEDDNAIWYSIETTPKVLRYIVEKGSITINGISLTVAYVDEHMFKVSIIPHTQKETNLHSMKVGSTVNLECDVIGKYVEKLMELEQKEEPKKSTLTREFLMEHGF